MLSYCKAIINVYIWNTDGVAHSGLSFATRILEVACKSLFEHKNLKTI